MTFRELERGERKKERVIDEAKQGFFFFFFFFERET